MTASDTVTISAAGLLGFFAGLSASPAERGLLLTLWLESAAGTGGVPSTDEAGVRWLRFQGSGLLRIAAVAGASPEAWNRLVGAGLIRVDLDDLGSCVAVRLPLPGSTFLAAPSLGTGPLRRS